MVENKIIPKTSPLRLIISVTLLCVVASSFLVARIMASHSLRYVFLFWNLFLAITPVLLAWWLVVRVRQHGWLKWPQIALSVLWLTFLPNSFYLVTDLIHLRPNYEADLLFDITLLICFILSGFILGFISVYLVQRELTHRLSERTSYAIVAAIFLSVSFAVFLGRYTRWNTWDILLRPAGLLFDVSDRFINPGNHLQTYQTTGTLFLMLFACYAVIWEAARLIRRK